MKWLTILERRNERFSLICLALYGCKQISLKALVSFINLLSQPFEFRCVSHKVKKWIMFEKSIVVPAFFHSFIEIKNIPAILQCCITTANIEIMPFISKA